MVSGSTGPKTGVLLGLVSVQYFEETSGKTRAKSPSLAETSVNSYHRETTAWNTRKAGLGIILGFLWNLKGHALEMRTAFQDQGVCPRTRGKLKSISPNKA